MFKPHLSEDFFKNSWKNLEKILNFKKFLVKMCIGENLRDVNIAQNFLKFQAVFQRLANHLFRRFEFFLNFNLFWVVGGAVDPVVGGCPKLHHYFSIY